MKTVIWIIFGLYVIFANSVFRRVREQRTGGSFADKIILAGVIALFESVFVGLPGYLLYRFLT